MSKITDLLEEVKKAKGVTTKYALAKTLELPTQRISDYYNATGSRYPDSYACLQIAKALGRSFEEVSAIVQIEAEKDEARREVWREHLKRLGGYAAAIMLWVLAGLVFVTLELTLPQKVYAASTTYDRSLIRNTNYARKKIAKLANVFVRIVREILAPRVCFSG